VASHSNIDERFMACNAAIKTLIEALLGTEPAKPHQIARLLRGQAQDCQGFGMDLAKDLLNGFADFAEDPDRIAGRRLLNEPPHGHA
jgi:hypothetical protein